ncbi:hypothetical protein [Fredinandcohnia sp. 179-A 10B2 NHS]|uniref:hypothetical protein n=1 Tax=Fredinandcohnia sp. 179-A 10B2 NHS TaxID=3235176 RepID=UPI0039A307F6
MEITRERLLQQLKNNNDIGFVEINQSLHEIRLINGNQIVFTGASWSWEQTQTPSAHGDYMLLTDVLMEDDPYLTEFPEQQTYEYYNQVSEYLS